MDSSSRTFTHARTHTRQVRRKTPTRTAHLQARRRWTEDPTPSDLDEHPRDLDEHALTRASRPMTWRPVMLDEQPVHSVLRTAEPPTRASHARTHTHTHTHTHTRARARIHMYTRKNEPAHDLRFERKEEEGEEEREGAPGRLCCCSLIMSLCFRDSVGSRRGGGGGGGGGGLITNSEISVKGQDRLPHRTGGLEGMGLHLEILGNQCRREVEARGRGEGDQQTGCGVSG